MTYEEILGKYLAYKRHQQMDAETKSIADGVQYVHNKIAAWVVNDADDYIGAVLVAPLEDEHGIFNVDIDFLAIDEEALRKLKESYAYAYEVLRDQKKYLLPFFSNDATATKYDIYAQYILMPVLSISFRRFLKQEFGVEIPTWAGETLAYDICAGRTSDFVEESLAVYIYHEQNNSRKDQDETPDVTDFIADN